MKKKKKKNVEDCEFFSRKDVERYRIFTGETVKNWMQLFDRIPCAINYSNKTSTTNLNIMQTGKSKIHIFPDKKLFCLHDMATIEKLKISYYIP